MPLPANVSKQGKASRGKHRRVGFQIETPHPQRKSVEALLEELLGRMRWRLFDSVTSEKITLCILRVSLSDCDEAVSILNSSNQISTLTKSGKIRLVRKRLEIEKPTRNR